MSWLKGIIWKIKSLFMKSGNAQSVESSSGITLQFNKEWREFLAKEITTHLETFRTAIDIDLIYPKFKLLTEQSQIDALVDFFALLINYESSNNPNSQNVDVGTRFNKDTWSIGLMQLSVVDQKNYNIPLGYTFDDLLDPFKNMDLGLKIMVRQIKKHKKIFIEKGEAGVYWAVIHPNGRYDKSEKIINFLHGLHYEYRKDVTDGGEEATPWLTIAKKELGVKEVAGSGNNKRIVEYHSFTTLKATEDLIPWCSSFVTWCLEQSGYKSTKSAWARSYLNYGTKLDAPKIGCIVVLTRGQASGHVAFYVGEDKDSVEVIGGNQSDAVCYQHYDKSRILGYRWPVK